MPDQSKSNPSRIFISYSNKDVASANELRRLCDKAGLSTWLDTHDLQAGEHSREKIEEEISKSDIFLILLSDALSSSESTPLEWSSICERSWKDPSVRLIPVRLNDVDPPSFLRRTKWLDALGPDQMTRCVKEIGALSNSTQSNATDTRHEAKSETDEVERFRALLASIARKSLSEKGAAQSGDDK